MPTTPLTHPGAASTRKRVTAGLIVVLMSQWLLTGFISTGHAQTTIPERQISPIAASSQAPAIEGWVTNGAGQAVQGAQVLLDGRTVATSDGVGHFSIANYEPSSGGAAGEPTQVGVEVLAEGYGRWSLTGAVYYTGDTLRLYPHLTAQETAERATASQPRTRAAAAHEPLPAELVRRLPFSGPVGIFDQEPGVQPQTLLPSSVRVYRTATATVEVVPLRDYVKHTLPNEWVPTWRSESLKAGAMAVKTYAAYWVSRGGKQVALGADVKDNTEDQVYDPNVSYASTDAAVDATFDYVATQGGALFQAQYCAGTYDPDPAGDCPWPGPYMTQWGSAYYADMGKPWGWILGFYYPNTAITPSPPGGGFDGVRPTPAPAPPNPNPNPTPAPAPPAPQADRTATYTIGQGSTRPDLFLDAYSRNGGAQVLGKPLGVVKWWLQYVSENNVLAQQLSGPLGKGDVWLVFDPFKPGGAAGDRVFLLSGQIAAAYLPGGHQPPGPEWVGAPTSDPFILGTDAGSLPAQSFEGGLLLANGKSVQFAPWPATFSGWEAEFFAGRPSNALQFDLPGQPAMVKDVPAPNFDWKAAQRVPSSLGVGNAEWSAQYTKRVTLAAGSYDVLVSATGGVRVWVDNMLALDGWSWTAPRSDRYNADLAAGPHTIRVQYFSTGGDARLNVTFGPRGSMSQPGSSPNPVVPGRL